MKKQNLEAVDKNDVDDEIASQSKDTEDEEKRTAPKYEENKLRGRIELTWPSKEFVFWDIYNGQPVWKREKEIPLRIIRQREIIGQNNCVYSSEKNAWVKTERPIQSENLLIKGDNLLALKALEEDFSGEVKLIYIDPPFNTGTAFEHYDDGLEHSTWLSMIKSRLEILKKLLKKEGVIFVHIDNNEVGYLRVVMDEIFGRSNFLQLISIKKATTAGFKAINTCPTSVTEYILMYAKDKNHFTDKPVYVPVDYSEDYGQYIENFSANPKEWIIKTIDEAVLKESGFTDWKDAKNKWGQFWREIRKSLKGEFAHQNRNRVVATKDLHKPTDSIKDLMNKSRIDRGKVFVYERKNNSPLFIYNGRCLAFFNSKYRQVNGEELPAELLTNFWEDISWYGTAQEGNVIFKNSKKPEKLLQRIIELGSEPGDIVLDSFAGSGTSAAVAHKLGRRWITIEIGKHAETHCKPRLSRVVSGEDSTGISKQVNWKGSGGFAYCELGDPIVITDKELGIRLINPKYNNGDLIRAICKLEGFKLIDNGKKVLHGKRGMIFAHVSEFYVTQEYLDHLIKEIDEDQKLILYCYAHTSKLKLPKNVEVRRMPDQLNNKDGDSNE